MYVWDPFQGMPLGNGTPNSWGFPGGGSGTVRAWNDLGAFKDHQWYSFSGQELTSPAYPHADSGTTAWFAYRNQGFAPNGPIFQLWSLSTTPGVPIRSLNAVIENDGTLSIYTAGSPDVLVCNTGFPGGATPYSFQCNCWFYLQINATMDFVAVGLTNYSRLKVDIILDGQLIVHAAQQRSNFYQDTNFPGLDNSFVFASWSQPNGSGQTGLAEPYVGSNVGDGVISFPGNLWDLIIDAPGSGYGPHAPTIVATPAAGPSDATISCTIDVGPGSGMTGKVLTLIPSIQTYLGDGYSGASLPVVLTAVPFVGEGGSGFLGHATIEPSSFKHVAQMVAEPAKAPIDAFVHASQMVVEHGFAPKDSFLRASQLVIELPFKRPPSSGWVLKEI